MFQERSTLLRVESRRLLSRCQRGLSWTTGSSSPSAGEIEVILPGTDFRAVYFKPTGELQLLAKRPPNGSHEFRARAMGKRSRSGATYRRQAQRQHQEGIRRSLQASRYRGRHASLLETHGRDLDHAVRQSPNMGGGGLSCDEREDAARSLWPPSPRLYARRRRGDLKTWIENGGVTVACLCSVPR